MPRSEPGSAMWIQGVKRYRRHPCEVTADRLLDDMERHPEAFNGSDRDAVARVRFILHEIADKAER